jgi:heptosyltransferase-2
MEDTARRILIKLPNWVGDVVLSIPAIKKLRGLYPDSYIAVLIKQELVDLLANNPAINEVLPYKEEKGLKKLSMIGRLIRTIRTGNFDTAILFPNSFSSALIVFLAGIPCRVGYGSDGRSPLLTKPIKVKDENRSIHQTCIYLNIIKEFARAEISKEVPIPHIYINEVDRAWAVNLVKEKIKKGKYLIGINPGARFGPAKRWLAERFVELGNRLTLEFNASIILFGGPEEKEFVSGIAAGIKTQQGDVLNMAGSTSLGQLAGLIERCNVFITNDTGPMHIAYSVGTPVVAIFGSTDPNRTGPPGDSHKIVKKDVPCSPCFKRVCPFDMECMKAIEVEDVMKAIVSLL